jgi:hypothetical protein
MQADVGFLNLVQARRLLTQAGPGLQAAKKPGGRPGRLGTLISPTLSQENSFASFTMQHQFQQCHLQSG